MSRYVRIAAACVVAYVAGSCAIAVSREWELRGKAFEAELVRVEGGIAWFQVLDGRLIGHSYAALGVADQRFIGEWLADEDKAGAGDEIVVTARSYWENVRYMQSATPSEIVLVVNLSVHGRDAARATQIKFQKLAAIADDGTALELSPRTSGQIEKAVRLDRYGRLEQPSWGYKVQLVLKAPAKTIASLRLTGSMQLVTGEPRSFIVDNIGAEKNRAVTSPLLTQAGLRMIENPWPYAPGVQLLRESQDKLTVYVLRFDGPASRVYAVELLEGKQLIEHFSAGRAFSGGKWENANGGTKGETWSYEFKFRSSVPRDPQLRITVLDEVREVTAPFETADVIVPPNRPMSEKSQATDVKE